MRGPLVKREFMGNFLRLHCFGFQPFLKLLAFGKRLSTSLFPRMAPSPCCMSLTQLSLASSPPSLRPLGHSAAPTPSSVLSINNLLKQRHSPPRGGTRNKKLLRGKPRMKFFAVFFGVLILFKTPGGKK